MTTVLHDANICKDKEEKENKIKKNSPKERKRKT